MPPPAVGATRFKTTGHAVLLLADGDDHGYDFPRRIGEFKRLAKSYSRLAASAGGDE